MDFVLISDNELSDDLMDFEKNLITSLQILSKEDILEIQRRRRLFYDKAIMNLLTKEILVDHLEREKKLLHICKFRIFDVNEDNRKMLRTLSNRLNCIYYTMILYKFYDIELISDYIKFAEAFDRYLDIKSPFILQHLISLPQSNAQMYLICARHLLIVFQNGEVALEYLSMGRKLYPECTELVVEQFYVETKRFYKRMEDETFVAAIAMKYSYFSKFFKNDITYDIGLLDVVLKFPMYNLHSYIIRDLITRYHSSELMWHKLAELHLQGFNYDFISQLVTYDSDMNKLTQIQNCFGVYEKGLIVNMPFHKKKLLSDFYLDTLIKLITTCNTKNGKVITYLKNLIDILFNRACDYEFVNRADHFIFWAENSNSGPLKPLSKSVTILRQNTVLWEKLLTYLLNEHMTHGASLIFFRGVITLEKDSINLWRLMEMYILNNCVKLTKDFYELGMVVEFDEINIEYRNKYLDWCFITYGINIVRKVFNAMINHNMLCLELYMKMINIELLQCPNEIDHNHIRDLYIKASDRYGHNRFEIWIDFIKYERSIGDFKNGDEIYKKSLICMKPEFRKCLMHVKNQLDIATIKFEPMDL